MPSLMQVGHCSLASLLQPAVSHTRGSTAAMLLAAAAAATQTGSGSSSNHREREEGKAELYAWRSP